MKKEMGIAYGKYYKAYKIKDRFILPYSDKKSLINRVAIFEKYAVRLEHKQYYDSIYGINEDFTLEKFLGLPKELNIDYNKKIILQLKFSRRLDRKIDPKEPFEIEKTNLYNKKVKENAYKEIRHQNACIKRGFLYLPDIKNAFILVDKIKRKDIRKLLPSISQYEIPNCINKGYNLETKGPNKIPNPYKEEQIKTLLKFFALPDELLAEIYFGADKKDIDLERVYKKYNLDKRYIALEGTIQYDSNYVSKIKIFDTGVVNIYKNLYYNLYEPLKSYLTKQDNLKSRKFDKANKKKEFKYDKYLFYNVTVFLKGGGKVYGLCESYDTEIDNDLDLASIEILTPNGEYVEIFEDEIKRIKIKK